MLDSTSIWIDAVSCFEPPSDFSESYIYYSISGDTLIDETLYYKFISYNNESEELLGFIFENDSGQVYFRIREDLDPYLICHFGSEFELLTDTNLLFIDFSAQIGDTLHLPLIENEIYVYNIGEDEIGGIIRKRIEFANEMIYGSWIEGIGGVYGGFFGSWCGVGIGCDTYLSCSTLNGEDVYGTCNIGISENEGEQLSFDVSPNPVLDYIKIEINSNSNINYKATIFNTNGIMVLNTTIINTTTEIKINNIPAGIYLLKLSSKDSYQTKRIIVK